MSTELKKQIKNHISNVNSANDIYDIFRLLNYSDDIIFDVSYKRDKEDFGFKKEDYDRIENIYSILSFGDHLPVFLLETTTLTPSFIRSVATKFDSIYMRFSLIFSITDDYSDILFVLPNREKVEPGKYKLKLTKLNVNKEEIKDKNEYYTVIDTLSNIYYDNEPRWRNVWKKWREAFNVERVTESFFEDYKTIFFRLRDKIKDQDISQKDAHEFTLQFLNRIMFIYFVSKKGWLEYPKFMRWFWNQYKQLNNYGSDEFYEKWLNQLFFNAFNNQYHKIEDLPDEVKKLLSGFPYLNGGLFAENKYDLKEVVIKDSLFQDIFEFFEKYNFTIKEDMPFESEVAVDPQMIGYVYESLANVADEIYDRNDMGIFYTPRVEVDFMCRRSLVEYFSKNLSDIPKEKFYHFIFDLPEDKWKTEEYFSKNGYWHKLESACDNLSVVDPACGSGAFLVGMLNVLDELYKIIYKHTKRDMTDFERKYRIIQYSLYGVDVMPWAIHAAELRLWLQLIIETELKGEELRKSPLLPNLNLNLRIGDSLVQEVGGVSFNVRTNDLDSSIKKKLDQLKHEKRLYYENSRSARFKDINEFKSEEIRLFEEIIKNRMERIHEKVEFLQKDSIRKQSTFRTKNPPKIKLTDKKQLKTKKDILNLKKEVKNLRKIKIVLKDPEKKPFVWDIDFAEIFGEKSGFDIVIGNPPYVTRTNISPPEKIKKDVTKKERDAYKKKLVESVQNAFPSVEMGTMSDYYVYFYFHGLNLLNQKGVFCFITSSSWLDVGYGKVLQEFLLKNVPIIAIYDNPKRSFSHADVNTIIALFGPPNISIEDSDLLKEDKIEFKMLKHTSKFVMFKKPFENVVNAKNLIEIEAAESKTGDFKFLSKNVVKTDDYRVFPILQKDLFIDGTRPDENLKKIEKMTYVGNKWGGKFLRAPDIFFEKLVPQLNSKIKDIANVHLGLTSGYNPFFYLKKDEIEKYGIEKKYLTPLIKSPKDCKNYYLTKMETQWYVLNIQDEKNDLSGTKALKYIEIAEESGIPKRPYFKNKSIKKWYKLPMFSAPLLQPYDVDKRHFTAYNPTDNCVDKRLVCIKPIKHNLFLWGYLNSIIGILMKELYGKSSLGLGALDNSVKDVEQMLTFSSEQISSNILTKLESIKLSFGNQEISDIFIECGMNPKKPFEKQTPKPSSERSDLDNIFFEELGLNKNERIELYRSVCDLVKNRLYKAKSLKGD